MRSRLEDLIATAERQLASRSYDAAIDNLRTSLSEPGAAEADVEARLVAACRVRDEARGIVVPIQVPIPAPAIEQAVETQLNVQREPELAPLAPPPIVDEPPIEPPSFSLIAADTYTFERPQQEQKQYQMEVEKLSILDPKPLPEGPDPLLFTRIAVAALIAATVFLLAYLLK
jgi:hypothetical protein